VVSDGYLICATPRTGSTLLCGLLASTGVAGTPESYFRAQDEAAWASRFGIAGHYEFAEFVRRARDHGSTPNGVFAARMMWGTLTEVVARLRRSLGDGDRAVSDLDVLGLMFGDLQFVYLWREDVIAQAVSWARAEQTNLWHTPIDDPDGGTGAEPSFDREQIAELCATIDSHNRAWREWFAGVGAQPVEVRYEDLDRDPSTSARDLLERLGIALPATTQLGYRDRRLRDDVSAGWIERFRAGA
jgi:LPS sulfotransferase NodH